MIVNDVLYVPILTQSQSRTALLGELKKFLDTKSQELFDKLFLLGLLEISTEQIGQIEEVEIEQDVLFLEISQMLDQKGLIPVDASTCIDFLYALRGKENADARRRFFERGGITLLSLSPLVIDGQLRYLVIAQDSVAQKEDDQRPFSVRLIPALKLFPHALYRVIAAKRA